MRRCSAITFNVLVYNLTYHTDSVQCVGVLLLPVYDDDVTRSECGEAMHQVQDAVWDRHIPGRVVQSYVTARM